MCQTCNVSGRRTMIVRPLVQAEHVEAVSRCVRRLRSEVHRRFPTSCPGSEQVDGEPAARPQGDRIEAHSRGKRPAHRTAANTRRRGGRPAAPRSTRRAEPPRWPLRGPAAPGPAGRCPVGIHGVDGEPASSMATASCRAQPPTARRRAQSGQRQQVDAQRAQLAAAVAARNRTSRRSPAVLRDFSSRPAPPAGDPLGLGQLRGHRVAQPVGGGAAWRCRCVGRRG